jgi:hypothetical protein
MPSASSGRRHANGTNAVVDIVRFVMMPWQLGIRGWLLAS